MTESKQVDAWNHTAQLLALTANCHRDPNKRKRPFQPRDFHPVAVGRRGKSKAKPESSIPMGSWRQLEAMLGVKPGRGKSAKRKRKRRNRGDGTEGAREG